MRLLKLQPLLTTVLWSVFVVTIQLAEILYPAKTIVLYRNITALSDTINHKYVDSIFDMNQYQLHKSFKHISINPIKAISRENIYNTILSTCISNFRYVCFISTP